MQKTVWSIAVNAATHLLWVFVVWVFTFVFKYVVLKTSIESLVNLIQSFLSFEMILNFLTITNLSHNAEILKTGSDGYITYS